MVVSRSIRFISRKRYPVTWAPESVWLRWRKEITVPAENQTLVVQLVSVLTVLTVLQYSKTEAGSFITSVLIYTRHHIPEDSKIQLTYPQV